MLRVIANSEAMPPRWLPNSGPPGTAPRDGLRPTNPQAAAGTRIDPPASVAWASGTIPAATAAALPPDEPPALKVRSNGLRHRGPAAGSLDRDRPNSGTVVAPKGRNPAARNRTARSLSASADEPPSAAEPARMGIPEKGPPKSLTNMGTPENGAFCKLPSGRAASEPSQQIVPRSSNCAALARASFIACSPLSAPAEIAAANAVASSGAEPSQAVMASRAVVARDISLLVIHSVNQAGSSKLRATSNSPAMMAARTSCILANASAGTSSATKLMSLPPSFIKLSGV